MDQGLLVGDTLTEEMIAAGEQLIQRLDKMNVLISGGCWWLRDDDIWVLVLITPELSTAGPKALYRKVRSASDKLDKPLQLALKDVMVTDAKDPAVILVRMLVQTTPDGMNRARFRSASINGQRIRDLLVYRMA